MKKPNAVALALLSAAAIAAFVATAPMPSSAAPAATESFVTNRIAQAIAAIPAPDLSGYATTGDVATAIANIDIPDTADYSTGNTQLVETIRATAPAPGNYAAVSNAAMNARRKTDLSYNQQPSPWACALYYGLLTQDGGSIEWDASAGEWRGTIITNGGVDIIVCIKFSNGWWYVDGEQVAAGSETDLSIQGGTVDYGDGDGTKFRFVRASAYEIEDSLALSSDIDAATNELRQTVFGKIAEEAENYAPAGLTNSVNTLWTYVYGESVWIAVTNYLRTVADVCPSYELWEVRDGSTNRVYSSREEISNSVHRAVSDCQAACQSNINNAVSNPVNRAWSRYDSVTGEEAPEGLTVIGTSAIQLSGGGTWQRYVSTGGSTFWTLQSNGLNPIFGGDTNGYFRVLDNEGNPTFEVRKTDAYLVSATPSGTGWSGDRNFTVSFASADGTRPDLYVATNIAASAFIPIGDDPNITEVNWTQTGVSGAYTNTAEIVQAIAQPQLFLYGEVQVEGETAIINTSPTRFDGGIIMGGVKYTFGTTTVNGKTVLTLEAAQ